MLERIWGRLRQTFGAVSPDKRRHDVLPDTIVHRAFLSYSSDDKVIAARLQRKLESYRIPRRLVGQPGEHGPVPKRLRPVFRDRADAQPASELGAYFTRELSKSQQLIVLCSPSSASPRSFVGREIDIFRTVRDKAPIHAVIVGGTPPSNFPEQLMTKKRDGTVDVPLAADLRPQSRGGDGARKGFVKLAAAVVGVSFDALWQRDKRRRRWQLVLAASVVLLAVSGVFYTIQQRRSNQANTLATAVARAVTLEERAQSLLNSQPYAPSVVAAYAMVASRLATPQQTEVLSQAWNTMQRVGFVRHLANYHFSSDSKDYSEDPFHGDRALFPVPVADRAISIRSNGETVVWDEQGEKPRLRIDKSTVGLAVSADGAIATFGTGNRLTLWSSQDGRELGNFTASSAIVSAAFNGDGQWLATMNKDQTVSLWKRSQKEATARFSAPGGPYRLRVCGDGALVGMAGKKGDIKIYARDMERIIAQLPFDSEFRDFAFVPDCGQLAIAEGTGSVRVVSTTDGSEVAKIPYKGSFAALSPQGNAIVTVSGLKSEYDPFEVAFSSLIDQREVSWLDETGSGFDRVDFTADGKGFVLWTHTQSGGGSLGAADLYALDLAGREDQLMFAGGKITAIGFDDARNQVEIATSGENVAGSNRSSNCQDNCGNITSSNGSWRLFLDNDGDFNLENLGSGKKTTFSSSQFFDSNFDTASAMAISQDGSTVAIAVSHHTGVFKIADLSGQDRDLKPRVTIPGDATALGFSPNGALLAVGTIAGTVAVAKVDGGEEWAVANAGAAITAVAVTNDGRFAAADAWGRARVWNASLDSMRKHLCDSLGSNLSAAEWKQDSVLRVLPPQATCENWPGR